VVKVLSQLHEDEPLLMTAFQVEIEVHHTSRHDVEYDSPLNVFRANTTAAHTDEAGKSDEDGHSDHSRGDHEPGGSDYEDEDDESEEEDGGDEEPALKYERMGGAAQEFFETGKDSASALCVGVDSFVSDFLFGTIAASSPLGPTFRSEISCSKATSLLNTFKRLVVYFPEVLSPRYLVRISYAALVLV
jgi:hypothetical protein